MANYANLKTAIQQAIKQNGNEEITGAILQTTLLSMVDSLASGHLFKGIARPLFAPATTDGPAFYIALEAGSYINFALTELGATAILREGNFGIFKTSGGSSNWTFTEVAISIKDGIVTTTKIANGAVTTEKIANGSITNDKIFDNAVSSQKIAPNAVTYNKIADGAVGTDKLADEAVTTDKIADGSITNDKIFDNAVSSQKIAPNAVTYNKIADGAVGTDKLADEAVTTDKIADDSITEQKLQSDSVNETAIQSDSIYERHIVDNEVTKRKLGQDVIEELENKANIDGSYESMSVGMAKNVEGTSPISGIFTFRPTAGNADVADGAAKVRSIKGNSVAWGQLCDSLNSSKYTNTSVAATLSISNGIIGLDLSAQYAGKKQPISIIEGHKYFAAYDYKTSVAGIVLGFGLYNGSSVVGFRNASVDTSSAWVSRKGIFTAGTYYSEWGFFVQVRDAGITGHIDCRNVNLFDLTLMFGAGNEPATPEAFEAWLQANVGLQTYYPYNAGELLSAKLLGIKTVGFNQWDGALESGYLDAEDGSAVANPNWKRSSNPIKVLPDTDYFIYTSYNYQGFGCLLFYDGQMNYLGYLTANQSILKIIKTPANCCFVHFYANNSFGFDTFCINLHYTNGRDGEYEPYVEHQYNFDTSKVYGKLNGEGNYVQVFPDGMKSAGSIRDELAIMSDIAIKRVGSVDLGTLAWWFSPSIYNTFNSSVSNIKVPANSIVTPKIKCARYTTYSINDLSSHSQPSISVYTLDGSVIVKDSAYSDAATFKTAMNGVMLYYELAEPVEYTDLVYRDNGVDTPIDALNILVSNYGTEEQIVESPTDGEPNSCAATLDILYGVNAADFMDAANNGAFVSKASLDALCNTLGSALGGTLTSTWNSAEGHYDFTFTPATRQIENQENNE